MKRNLFASLFAVLALLLVSPARAQAIYYDVVPGAGPHDVAATPGGGPVYYTAQRTGKLGILDDWSINAIVKFDPATENFASYPSDKETANVRQMLGRAGEAWGAESGADRLVMVPSK